MMSLEGRVPRIVRTRRVWLLCPAVLATLCNARSALAQAEQAVPEEVSIRGLRRARNANEVTVSAPDARHVAGSEGDPAKVAYDLPGVARSAFESGKLIVWGAAPQDTRVSVDGVEIPQLLHGSALRSTVNGELLSSVTLTPGAYGADYGRSIGGVLRLETGDLPASGLHGYLAADTLDGSAMVSAAAGDRLRVAVAGRFGWLDGVLRAVDAPDVGDYFAIPRYRDYQAKAQFVLRERESLDAVALGSADDLTRVIADVDPTRARTETATSAFQRAYLRYRRRLDDGSEVDVVPWIGKDASHLDQRFGAIPAVLDQQTWRWGLRASHRSRAGPHVSLGFGVDIDGSDAHLSRSGSMTLPSREGDITVFGQPLGGDTNADAWDVAVVDVSPNAQIDVDVGAWAVTAGLRFDGYLMDTSRKTPRVGQTPSIGLSRLDGEVQPRLATRLRVSPRLSLVAAAGLYSQPPASSDLSAVFGTPSLGPERARHVSAGEALLLTHTLSAEVTAFYKAMTDLAVRDPSPSPRLAQALVQDGAGRSYGIQLLLRQRPWRGFSGWVSYTVSRSERRDGPGANWRLFDYDQPHVLTILGSKEIGAFTVGVRFRYARGLPRTPVAGALFDASADVFQPIFGAQNSIRLPDFWQLDVRLDRSFVLGESARLLVYLEGLNVTDRANAEEFVYSADTLRRGAITGLPVIAVLGARVQL